MVVRRHDDEPSTPVSVVLEERTVPRSLDAEKSLLGAILVDHATWPLVAGVVTAADFFRDAHRQIFEAMAVLAVAGDPIDFVSIKETLGKSGDLDACGGPAYLASLADGTPRATNVEYYAKVVVEKARLRSAIHCANKLLVGAYQEDAIDGLLDGTVRDIFALASSGQAQSRSVRDVLRDYSAKLDTPDGLGIKTGFVDLDDLLGGIPTRKVAIVAARPSVGKTSFAVSMVNLIAAGGTPVGFVTLEQDDVSLVATMLSHESRVPSERVRRQMVNQRDWGRIALGIETLGDRPIHFVKSAATLTQAQAWARRLRDEHGVRVLVIDYVQLMGTPGARDRQQEIAAISRGLHKTAEELDMLFVVLSQLSRASEGRSDKRPQLQDLRESGALEQDADVVILLFRAEMYDRDPNSEDLGIAEVIVAKNRQGPVGTVKLAFLAELGQFTNLAGGSGSLY